MGSRVALPAGYRLVAYDSIGSTNAEAARLAKDDAPDGTVVWSRCQTEGRGRLGRRWESPEGNLYCSLLLRPDAPLSAVAQLTFVASLAVGQALDGIVPRSASLSFKWPNDVLLEGRKVAGILLESSGGRNGRLDWLVVGCGLNVRHFPTETTYPATSLCAAGVAAPDIGDLLGAFVQAFASWRSRWQAEGFRPVREAWLARASLVGGEISVRLPDSELRGRFTGLDESGSLLLDLADGCRRTVTAGDVFF